MKWLAVVVVAVTLSATSGRAQVEVRTGLHFERYAFDRLPISAVSEFMVPVTVTTPLGRRANLVLTTGLVSLALANHDPSDEDQTISGPLDTEARVTIDILPGRLMWLLNGALPTGIQSLTEPELSALTIISQDIIGFAANDLGAGGYIGSGIVAAFPVGNMALGVATTYRQSFSYTPVQNDPRTLHPGGEARIRVGLEGPLGPRTYLRTAGIISARQNDAISDTTVNGIGHRLTGYVSLNQGIGSTSATFYAFDVFRGNPQIEPTSLGTGFLPRGNLFVAGANVGVRVSPEMLLTPSLEYRISHAAGDEFGSAFERIGSSLRVGLNIRRQLTERVGLSVDAGVLTGDVTRFGGVQTNVGISGYRGAVRLELRP